MKKWWCVHPQCYVLSVLEWWLIRSDAAMPHKMNEQSLAPNDFKMVGEEKKKKKKRKIKKKEKGKSQRLFSEQITIYYFKDRVRQV
jgi:hypothetical protein